LLTPFRYPQYKTQLDLVIVEDIAKPNVFDDLVKGTGLIYYFIEVLLFFMYCFLFYFNFLY
jgi:hypothetical protein